MNDFVAIFRVSAVSDEVVIHYNNTTEQEAWEKAYEQSRQPHFVDGDFDLYIKIND